MLWSVLTTSPSRPTSTPTAYSSAPRRISSASLVRLGDHALAARPRRRWVSPRSSMRNAACSWASATIRSASSWAFSMIRSPSALMRLAARTSSGTATRSSSMSPSARVLVDDDVRRERQLLAVRDQRLEALDEEDDVDRSALPARRIGPGTRGREYGTRTCAVSALRSASSRAVRGGGRDHRRDVAAEPGDLLDQARADVAVLDRGHEEDRVDVGRQDPVVVGQLHLDLEVADGPQAADDRARRRGRGRSRPSGRRTRRTSIPAASRRPRRGPRG